MKINIGLSYGSFAVVIVMMWVTVGLFPDASAQSVTPNTISQAAPPPGGRSIPNVSQQQAVALVHMDADLLPLAQNVTVARSALAAAIFLDPRNDQVIQTQVSNLKAAEMALANAREAGFAKLQNSPNRLSPDQVAAFAAMGATATPAGGRGRSVIPDISQQQSDGLALMATELQQPTQDATAANAALATASLSERNTAGIQAAADNLGRAELALANARASAFAKLQASPGRLTPAQVTALTAIGGVYNAGVSNGYLYGPTPTEPLNFNDHTGYVPLFDGVSLKGWDSDPKFWRVEAGEIIGESTPQNPSGNNYLVYRATQAHDFTLKLEIRVDNPGGSGIQYRSQTGIPWVTAIPLNVTANVGPVNLDWIMTGPQADFWPGTEPASRYTGQFYTENDPMRIMSRRGEVVEGAGLGPKRLMGTIGDSGTLYGFVKPTGWNEYTIIARGGTFIHIINGQLMSVMVDDDPNSANNKSGYIGVELEANAKVEVRNVWLKKLN